MTLQKGLVFDTQQKCSTILLNFIMLSVIFIYCYAEYIDAWCRYAECHYVERHYAECRGAGKRTFLLDHRCQLKMQRSMGELE
jgi:hypothetical protein